MQVMRNYSPCYSTTGGRQQKWISKDERWRMDSPKNRDEDLALFHDMRTREHKNFLHPSTDDLEASLPTKLGGLTGFRISATQTPPWKGNDLLATDSEKNDYDWLLTPPGTPLFPSLDKDSLQTYMDHSLLTQTYSVSKVSRLPGANDSKISRRSPGPRTPTSISSSTNSSNTIMRGRALSPARVISSPTLRPTTPVKSLGRSTTTLNRASTRSSTPTLRRMNTSPSIRSSSAERNASAAPKGRSRGASISPKLQAWQAPELGFSAEPPPNLRTSLSDRPLSGSRGMASRPRPANHVEARHSYSETVDARPLQRRNFSSSASKVSSSTTSQDRWSSRGSVMSSSDDGMDAIEPTFLDFSVTSPSSTSGTTKSLCGRFESEASSKYTPTASRQKRSTNTSETPGFSSVSARKSLEPSMQRVDHRRVSQNMFRPLLSSAPTSSFYHCGHNVITHKHASPFIEPSITASSNASSEKDVRIFPGSESSDEGEGEAESEWVRSSPPDKNQVTAIDLKVPEYDSRYDQLEHESVHDSTSSPVAATIGCETDIIMNISSRESSSHEAFTESNQISHEADPQAENIASSVFLSKDYEDAPVNEGAMNFNTLKDDTTFSHTQKTVDQVYVDMHDNLPVQCKGTFSWHDDVPNHSRNLSSQEPYTSGQERLKNATLISRNESIDSHPQNFIDGPVMDTKLSPPARITPSKDKSVLNSSTNVSTHKIPFGDAKYLASLHSHERAQSACFNEDTEPSEREQLPVGDPLGHFMQEMRDNTSSTVPCLDKTHSETSLETSEVLQGRIPSSVYLESEECLLPDTTRNTGECGQHPSYELKVQGESSICQSVPNQLFTYEHELQAVNSSQSTPRSHQEPVLHQADLVSQDSGHEYHGDIPTTEKEIITGSTSDNVKTPSRLSLAEIESLEDLEMSPGASKTDKSQVYGNSYMLNLDNEIAEQFNKATAFQDVQATFSRKEGSDLHSMENQIESNDKQLDEATDNQGTLFLGDDSNGNELFQESMVTEASGNTLNEGCKLDQTEPQYQSGDRFEKVLNEVQPHRSTPEMFPEHAESREASLIGSNEQMEADTVAQVAASLLTEGGQQQLHVKESPSKTPTIPGCRSATPSFSLEEATNTILFCSSIVHDMVYKATSIATEKEAISLPPLTYQVRGQLSNADYIRSLRGKVSRPGTWKGRNKEDKSLVKKAHKEDPSNLHPAITQHPTPIHGMEKGDAEGEAIKVPSDTVKDKSYLNLSVNSNCQCNIM